MGVILKAQTVKKTFLKSVDRRVMFDDGAMTKRVSIAKSAHRLRKTPEKKQKGAGGLGRLNN